VALLAL